MSAEQLFFCALSSAIGVEIDRSSPQLVYADSNMNTYTDPSVSKLLNEFRITFGSTNDFSNRFAPVDGVIRNHKTLGTRVVEFDEFQHFTPQRKMSISIAKSYCPLSFHDRYLSYCDNPRVISESNRTTNRSGFHKPVAGFRYDGGRMSQRAYFDTMKDYIHLSERGRYMRPTIRISIPDFDVMTVANFIRLDIYFIEVRIQYLLSNLAD